MKASIQYPTTKRTWAVCVSQASMTWWQGAVWAIPPETHRSPTLGLLGEETASAIVGATVVELMA
jgi:hypothetical protein